MELLCDDMRTYKDQEHKDDLKQTKSGPGACVSEHGK